MKTINKLSFLFALLCSGNLVAQIQFQLSWLPQESAYLVSMVPQTDWAAPFNITSTAQVTLKVPTEEFELNNFLLQIDQIQNVNLLYDYLSKHPVQVYHY